MAKQQYYDAYLAGLVPVLDSRRVRGCYIEATVSEDVGPYKKGELITFYAHHLVEKIGLYPSGHIKVRTVAPQEG